MHLEDVVGATEVVGRQVERTHSAKDVSDGVERLETLDAFGSEQPLAKLESPGLVVDDPRPVPEASHDLAQPVVRLGDFEGTRCESLTDLEALLEIVAGRQVVLQAPLDAGACIEVLRHREPVWTYRLEE